MESWKFPKVTGTFESLWMLYLYNECQCFSYLPEFSLSQSVPFCPLLWNHSSFASTSDCAKFFTAPNTVCGDRCTCIHCWSAPPPSRMSQWMEELSLSSLHSSVLCHSCVDMTWKLGANGLFCLQLLVKREISLAHRREVIEAVLGLEICLCIWSMANTH